MIILLRGTSGSGKTYIAWEAMNRAGGIEKARGIPLGPRGKVGALAFDDAGFTIIGRYDVNCGGCDTQTWPKCADDQEAVILSEAARGQHVLFEGLLVSSWGVPRLKRLDAAAGLLIIFMGTSFETCVAAVKARRLSQGMEKPLDEANTLIKYKALITTSRNNLKAGLKLETLDRAAANARVMGIFGL